jgi:transcriptional regulator with XRE-family HTH domain
MGLPERLRMLRTRKGWTQQEAAEHAGVSKKALANWERGSSPQPKLLRKVAQAYGVSVEYLTDPLVAQEKSLFGDETPPPAPTFKKAATFPGIRALLADTKMCASLGVTDEERHLLESEYAAPVGPRDINEAVALLHALRKQTAWRS